ncbi:MAG TPA: alpha/beta hydrolase, partial [Thermomicrobiales bacterium]
LHALATMTPAAYAHARAPQLLAPNPSPDVLREVETMFARIHPAGFRSAAIALAHADVRDVLPCIRVPTLVLCGEQDRVTAPALGTRLIGEIANAHMVVFPGVGHLNNMEQPDQYNATVRAFLDAVVVA